MDPKELCGLMEAYSEVYVSQEKKENTEVVDEGKLPLDKERRDRIGRQIGRRTYSSSPKKYDQMDKMSGALKSAQKKQNNEELDIFDVVLEFLQVEGFAETLEEAEWMMANVIDEEAIGIILGEASYSAKAARAGKDIGKPGKMFAKIAKSAGERYGSEERGRKVAGAVLAKLRKEEYVDEAQEARNNPEKYEADQKKKSAPVRGERTPMPPRGDKRREDFEKWYAKQMGR